MWYKNQLSANVTQLFRYTMATNRYGEALPELNDTRNKALYKNTEPAKARIALPAPGGKGRYLVNDKWRFETVREATQFAEKFLVPFLPEVTVEETTFWACQVKPEYTRIHRYKSEKNASRYGIRVESPDVPETVVSILTRKSAEGENPIYTDSDGPFVLRTSEGEKLGTYESLDHAERAAKSSGGYLELHIHHEELAEITVPLDNWTVEERSSLQKVFKQGGRNGEPCEAPSVPNRVISLVENEPGQVNPRWVKDQTGPYTVELPDGTVLGAKQTRYKAETLASRLVGFPIIWICRNVV
jgi:hypothetical protein